MSEVEDTKNVWHVLFIIIVQSQNSATPEVSLFDCGAKMLVRGTVANKAYVTAKATVGDAVQVKSLKH